MTEIRITGHAPIYAVDDDPMFQEILQFAYSQSDLPNDLILLSSGYECIDKLAEAKDDGAVLPAMILMDINMPGMNGIETVAKIRATKSFKTIPIITMLSSSNEELDVARSVSAGADDYCEKPFDITTLKFVRA